MVSGRVEVTLRKEARSSKPLYLARVIFSNSPYVIHSMTFPEDCILAAMYDVPVEKADGTKDILAQEV